MAIYWPGGTDKYVLREYSGETYIVGKYLFANHLLRSLSLHVKYDVLSLSVSMWESQDKILTISKPQSYKF